MKTIDSIKTSNFFDSFLEIHKEPYFLNITSTLSEAIYYQVFLIIKGKKINYVKIDRI